MAGNGDGSAKDVYSTTAIVSSLGNNLIGKTDDTTALWLPSDKRGTVAAPLDALLAPLGNYGGLTTAHALLPGSPAINAGDNCVLTMNGCGNNNPALATDQRGAGFNRQIGGVVDIGAFEANYALAATSGTPQNTTVNTAFAQPLQATLTESGNPISGVTITFTAPGSGASATFPSGNTATTNASGQASVNVTANASAGSYSVTANTTPGLATAASFSLSNTCPTITAMVSGSTSICSGDSANVTVIVSGGTAPYTVMLSNGSTQTGTAMHTVFTFPVNPSSTTTYNVQSATDFYGCAVAASGSATITVKPTPAVNQAMPSAICSGGTTNILLSGTSGASFSWTASLQSGSVAGFSSGTGSAIAQTLTGGGVVKYTVTATLNGCPSAPVDIFQTVNPTPPTPTIAPNGPTTFCDGGSVTLTSSSATGNQWYLNSNPIGGATNQSYVATASGDYTVVVTQNGCGSAPLAATKVTVNSNPATPAITPVQSQVCAASTGNQASGLAGATSYEWSITNGVITSAANIQTVTYTAGASGNVTLNLTVTNASNCGASNSVNVPINSVPTCNITGLNTVAPSTTNSYMRSSSLGGSSFSWAISGNGSISGSNTNSSVNITAGTSGSYTLTLTVSKNGCSSTCTMTVNIAANPPTVYASNLSDPLACSGPGNTVSGKIQLNNPNVVALSFTLDTSFTNLVGVQGSCSLTGAALGATCVVTAGGLSASGSLPANATFTVNYQAQITDQPNGATVKASSIATLGAGSAQPNPLVFTANVNCPEVGPGAIPDAKSPVSDQKAGSVLIYNLYTSSASSPNAQNTRISLTNIHSVLPARVHLFFVDGSNCAVADNYVCLTPNQTTSFLASDLDPGSTGYIVAVAVDDQGCPVNFNYLIGDEYVKLESGHAANLGAEAFSAIAGGLPRCDENSTQAELRFDGVSYSQAPRVLALSNIPSRADGNDTMLVLNRIGGNLAASAATLTNVFGIFYDDAETGVSFSFNPGVCQFRSSVTNTFPRIAPRFETLVPSGRSGWLKLYSTSDQAILGAAINFNQDAAGSSGAFNQGHNLHKLTLTSGAVFTIPVFPPSC
ncbi:MAG: choice-of-anchor Q domain-containing protein [Blastocatellales bacterium]